MNVTFLVVQQDSRISHFHVGIVEEFSDLSAAIEAVTKLIRAREGRYRGENIVVLPDREMTLREVEAVDKLLSKAAQELGYDGCLDMDYTGWYARMKERNHAVAV